MILAVAIVAVAAVAIVGAAYAYTATTQSDNNTSDATYTVLTIGNNQAADYTTGKFTGGVKFNTTNATGTPAYTIAGSPDNTTVQVIADPETTGVALGEAIINVAHTNLIDNPIVKFSVQNITASGASAMDGTYYIGYKTSAEGTYKYALFDKTSQNFFVTESTTSAVTSHTTSIGNATTVYVQIVVTALGAAPGDGHLLNDVTFEFKAEIVPTPQNP